MPLARFHLYAHGVEVWIAPTLAQGDGWIATMRHIAIEGRVWVIGPRPRPRVAGAEQGQGGYAAAESSHAHHRFNRQRELSSRTKAPIDLSRQSHSSEQT